MTEVSNIIHVRFAPNGTVVEIGARPETLTTQQWFNFLSDAAASNYQTLAGGRGVFRIPQIKVADLQNQAIEATSAKVAEPG